MEIREVLALNLRKLRQAQGLSQEELAHRARVHQTYLSGVEGGKRNPSIDVLGRVAAALGADIEELFRRRSTKTDSSGASLKVRGARKKVE